MPNQPEETPGRVSPAQSVQSPKLCTLCSKSQEQGRREVVLWPWPLHHRTAALQGGSTVLSPCHVWYARLQPLPEQWHSSETSHHRVKEDCLPDPTSFYIPASWPLCIPWILPGATSVWPRWQAAGLQACVIPSSSMHLQQCHNHCSKVQGGPLQGKEEASTLSLYAQLLEKTWRYFQLFEREFNAWKSLSQLCSMIASCPKEQEDTSNCCESEDVIANLT